MRASAFRTKPIVVDAMRWDGSNGDEVFDWVLSFGHDHPDMRYQIQPQPWFRIERNRVSTYVAVGDWLIRTDDQDFLPCSPELFEAMCEPELVTKPAPDPETQCTVCGSDTATVRCCGWPKDDERQDYDR